MGRVLIRDITAKTPPFIKYRKKTGRRRKGEIYEQQVHEKLLQEFPCYLPSLWFHFADAEHDSKWCQPDALLLDPWRGQITIVEVKYQHTERAYIQLFDLYLPVVLAAFGSDYQVACVEVCRWYDPAVLTQVRPSLCERIERAKPSSFNVHILAL